MAYRSLLTAARLREVLNYNPETGEFVWVYNPTPRSTLGFGRGRQTKVGGAKVCGGCCVYHVIGVDRVQYHAHRLAWLWMTGKWPRFEIDHINRNSLDNRWKNLRDVTHRENEQNKGLLKTNTSGVRGLSWCKKTQLWIVHLSYSRKRDAIRAIKTIQALRKVAP